MTMIEQVTRAIRDSFNSNDIDCIPLAKAAIEAMREPSDTMMNIYYELNHRAGPRATFDVSTWERSIDAALKE